ncbi:6-phosphogluconate phosphatase [Paraburkholderia nemoris]|uniref:6-phosphogluconate phosphatase n=1 Tax=Paraburkholderia nemoris TaxID=2793076 RepID=A0ABM8RLD5_9BURK|nr:MULTISPECIES: HAD family phosphatase [Paraburkholderia]MBK5149344.1 HAD family phosphatase [Burkholderia sp. R-69608]MBK3782647.1 HAD family phosphatase [Paraburkholderia aspalathi]MBK3811397.1 HAD family phosphatase [Paraburkholderia aspalathi]CAE6759418.1 6-phosphogluconate phosphatase [Paraburkholderia nemoris]CAE6773413.1 6-phosphogluconate phosphatase [Paraburkholderia nemoris]
MTAGTTVGHFALICDCDGVLIDSEAVAAHMLVHELEARWPDADVAPVVLPLLGLRIETVLQGTAAKLGRSLGVEDIEAIRRAVEAAAMQAPAVVGIEVALAQVPLTKACASNSFRPYVENVLARTGLVKFFGNRLFCADAVPNPKPAPDVYLAAAQGLGLAPSACLVVEDSVTGVTAATAAGMTVLGFIGGGHASDAQIDALHAAGARTVFDDMLQLPDLVAQWTLSATAATP